MTAGATIGLGDVLLFDRHMKAVAHNADIGAVNLFAKLQDLIERVAEICFITVPRFYAKLDVLIRPVIRAFADPFDRPGPFGGVVSRWRSLAERRRANDRVRCAAWRPRNGVADSALLRVQTARVGHCQGHDKGNSRF